MGDIATLLLLMIFPLPLLSIAYWTIRAGISPMPSSQAARAGVLTLLEAPMDRIVDLGSGWGGLARCLAKTYPSLPVLAFELSFWPYWYSRCVQRLRPLANLQLMRGSFYTLELAPNDRLIAYLYPGAMQTLAIFLDSKAQAISNNFESNNAELRNIELISISFRLPGTPIMRTYPLKQWFTGDVTLYRLFTHVESREQS